MTDLEYDVLDELYFVTTFKNLNVTIELPEKLLEETLKSLMRKNWVQQLQFNTRQGEYVKRLEYSFENLNQFAYLATKEGLLIHNGVG